MNKEIFEFEFEYWIKNYKVTYIDTIHDWLQCNIESLLNDLKVTVASYANEWNQTVVDIISTTHAYYKLKVIFKKLTTN